jgi:hypothetical protein
MPGAFLPPKASDPRVQSLLGTTEGSPLATDINTDVRNALADLLSVEHNSIQIDDAWHQYCVANGVDPFNPPDDITFGGGGGGVISDPSALTLTTTLTGTDMDDLVSTIGGSFPSIDGVWFNPDGTIVFGRGVTTDRITSWDLTTPYDLAGGATIKGAPFGINGPQCLTVHDDGNKFCSGLFSESQRSYGLTTPYTMQASPTVISTASNTTLGFDAGSAVITLCNDGNTVLIFGEDAADWAIASFQLGTQYDLTTIGAMQKTVVEGTLALSNPFGDIQFSSDGAHIYCMGKANVLTTLDCSTPFDASTAVYDSGKDLALQTGAIGFLVEEGNGKIYVFNRNITQSLQRCWIYAPA